jgi:hypothetical protein
MQACLGFVQNQERSGPRREERGEQAQVAKRPVGELECRERTAHASHLHRDDKAPVLRVLDGYLGPVERVRHVLVKGPAVADLLDRDDGSREIRAVVCQHRGTRAHARMRIGASRSVRK